MDYSPNARLEDRLGPHEPPYRSRGEAQVGRLLGRYGIDFLYEDPTPIYDRGGYYTWHPDFKLPAYDYLIVEYAGMPDVPEYMAGVRHKERVYRANGMRALFVYPDDLRGPRWPEALIERIRRMGQRTGNIKWYRSRAISGLSADVVADRHPDRSREAVRNGRG